MVDAPRGKAASTWMLPLPSPYPFVCSVSARAFPFMHILTIHADDKRGSKRQVETRER